MPESLHPSKLGSKEHWDAVYAEELTNFNEMGDEGEVWFGEDSVEKMTAWCLENVPPTSSPRVLEVGSGNGILLISLSESGYEPTTLRGIDYSPDAIELAKRISKNRGAIPTQIQYYACDFLKQDLSGVLGETILYNIILDKGTFDAMALSVKNADGTSPSAAYPHKIAQYLASGGYFLITSCNFTDDELVEQFTTQNTGLKYHSRIQHKTFSFGGKSGSICSSVAFQKT